MKYHKKSKSYFAIIAMIAIFTFPECAFADLVVQKIVSDDLHQERVVFEKFHEYFCGFCLQQPAAQQLVRLAFDYEERSYAEKHPTTLFFHALVEDEVVGYISCDLMPGYQVSIRQFAIDPEMGDATLVKELLFAIFAQVPKTRRVSLACPIVCTKLHDLFMELGFVKKQGDVGQAVALYDLYELVVHPKCKICEVLYGPNFWAAAENEQDWGAYDADLSDGYLEDSDDHQE